MWTEIRDLFGSYPHDGWVNIVAAFALLYVVFFKFIGASEKGDDSK